MATDVERLVVSLEASITKYERAMNKALGATNTTTRRIESRFESMNRRVSSGFSGLQRGIAAAFAGAAALRGATSLIDSATRIENSLKVAGLAGEELDAVYQKLYQSARNNAAPLESLVTLYGRAVLVQNELGVSTEQLLSFTDNVALALRVSGQSAAEASGALLQLSQALGSGVVRAEEFNSILEGAPTILQAAAAGIAEAEGSVAKLRTIMLDGNLSSRALFDGFEAGSVILEEKVAGASLTVSQAFENLRTELINVAREMDEGTNISGALAGSLGDLTEVIKDVAAFANAAVEPLTNMTAALQGAVNTIRTFIEAGAAVNGLDRVGAGAAQFINDLGIPGLTAGSSRAGNVLTGTFELLGATPQDEALAGLLTGEQEQTTPTAITVNAAPRTISIEDDQYSTAGMGSSSGGGSGGGSGGNTYQQAIEAREKAIQQLAMEAALTRQATLANNDHGFSVERLRAQMELENAAIEAGLALTPQRRAEIDQLSESYARASANAEVMATAQQLAEQAFDDLASAGRNALDTIIDGFLEGKDAGEIFNSVLKDLAKNLINIGLNQLGGGMQAGGFNPLGFLGGLFGFSKGTPNTGGARGQVRGVVHGQEAVIPLPSGGKVPVEMKMPTLPQMGQGQLKIMLGVSADSAGNLTPFVESVVQTGIGRSAPMIVGAAVGQANKSAPAAMARHQQQRAGSDYRTM